MLINSSASITLLKSLAIWLLFGCGIAQACDLRITAAWIRAAPPTASSLAGYATLTNTGTKPLTIISSSSTAFADVQMHESVESNGMVSMRLLERLTIAPGKSVSFAPNGKHFMLMNPASALHAGDVAIINIKDASGCETSARFKVTRQLSDDETDQHMDHSHMHHDMHDNILGADKE